MIETRTDGFFDFISQTLESTKGLTQILPFLFPSFPHFLSLFFFLVRQIFGYLYVPDTVLNTSQQRNSLALFDRDSTPILALKTIFSLPDLPVIFVWPWPV